MSKNDSELKQMNRPPAQLVRLWLITLLGAFQPAGAAWVALLAARGFSLAEVGLAEGVFHLTSLLCEVPSGVLADVLGRKRSMVLSQIAAILSAVFMVLSDTLAGVCLAMAFSALGYNFSSGAREALAFEELAAAGREEEYDRYSAADLALYFREMRPLVGTCSFGMSCNHNKEPGCKIQEAVYSGVISEERFDSWQRICDEITSGSWEY